MTASSGIFLGELERHYGKSGRFGPGFSDRIATLTSGLSADQISRAVEALVRSCKTFPGFRECENALKAVRMAKPGVSVEKAGQDFDFAEQSREAWRRKRVALRLCRCDLGRQARAQGWLRGLADFCADHERLPDASEIARLKATNRRCREKLEECRGGFFFSQLTNLWAAMQEAADRDVFGFAEDASESAA